MTLAEGSARLIGAHFKEIDDKLINLLQLSRETEKSELLLAGIEKRSAELRHIPFQRAIDLKANLKYLKYLSLPLLVIAIVWLSGKTIEDYFQTTGFEKLQEGWRKSNVKNNQYLIQLSEY